MTSGTKISIVEVDCTDTSVSSLLADLTRLVNDECRRVEDEEHGRIIGPVQFHQVVASSTDYDPDSTREWVNRERSLVAMITYAPGER